MEHQQSQQQQQIIPPSSPANKATMTTTGPFDMVARTASAASATGSSFTASSAAGSHDAACLPQQMIPPSSPTRSAVATTTTTTATPGPFDMVARTMSAASAGSGYVASAGSHDACIPGPGGTSSFEGGEGSVGTSGSFGTSPPPPPIPHVVVGRGGVVQTMTSSSAANPTTTTSLPPPPPFPGVHPRPPPVVAAPPPWPTTMTTTTTTTTTTTNRPLAALAGVGDRGGTIHPPPPPVAGMISASLSGESDAAVLLGLEELERQQADVEKRRAAEALKQREQQQQKQQQQQRGGLPPLSPPYPPGGGPTHPQATSSAAAVPSQIHLFEDDEDTTLSAGDSGDRVVDQPGLRRAVSIEKLRGSVQVGLRRLRSWSQDTLNRSSVDNPATGSSVDSTQPATLSDSEQGGGGVGGEGADGRQSQHRQTIKASHKKLPMSERQPIVSEPDLDVGEARPLVYGYLHKLGRNGRWQHRFFETDGERLTYYKDAKRTNVLATLDLCKVGEITIDKTDPDECTFTIQVKNRPYFLRAESKARCNDWVIILNRAREARMNVGNIQFVKIKSRDGVDGPLVALNSKNRDQSDSDEYAQPCIVISALRPRTRAMRDFDEELDVQNKPPDLLTSSPPEEEEEIEVLNWADRPTQEYRAGVGDSQSMAKWQKRHSVMHTLSMRFLRWARSITRHADMCRRESDVVVVPAHVVLAMQQQQQQQQQQQPSLSPQGTENLSARATLADAGERRRQRQSASGLPVLIEMTPEAEANLNRSRASTESRTSTDSPGFGHTFL
ncbi:hypothetical protein ACHAXA_010819 [Cyclostephanos tholiformis]|uniref:PH domain-containing protein n=1 Tax=Cyclostephanos tholiformis TaxID=382380 RepID=A0ABD3SGD5_9STRA